ncbi:hypothetical protein WICPIJ_001777 [Wickerhamomyces pijperi]|uniref:Secreted protein n=1 Tax=Wickerhamomyces pijperi TaxID=599730 RepID=A0A9P8TQ96_WICPI|nr:hypothetical protein WICPIJ_001777 [Wickerhamomyces pijperi]
MLPLIEVVAAPLFSLAFLVLVESEAGEEIAAEAAFLLPESSPEAPDPRLLSPTNILLKLADLDNGILIL